MFREYYAVDLFSGAGGMAEGFKQAGFKCVFANDFDEVALQTFAYNHPETPYLKSDIRKLDAAEILRVAGKMVGEIDVVCGGPPCQGFSLAGLRMTDDPRNRLFLDFVRIVDGLSPRVVVFENVPGIITMQGGAVIRAITAEFAKIGYTCQAKILNAADYGVPQVRERFFLIGTREGCEGIDSPPATHGGVTQLPLGFTPLLEQRIMPNTPYVTLWDALSDLPRVEQGEGAEELQHSDIYHNAYQQARRGHRQPSLLFNHRATRHSEAIQYRYAQIPEGSNNGVLPPEIRTRKRNVFKPWRDKPSPTVTCNHRTDLIHPTIPRGTTVREAARLQSFDDDYRFFGNLTRKAKWVTQDDQVGNAVPPLLARAVAAQILFQLQQHDTTSYPSWTSATSSEDRLWEWEKLG